MTVQINKKSIIQDKEDFIELLLYFWKRKLIIIILSTVGFLSSFIYSIQLESIYTAEAVLIPNSQSNNMTDIASRLSGFGAFSAFGGNISRSNKSSIAVPIMESRSFFSSNFYDEYLPHIYAVKSWDKEENILIYDENLYDKETDKWLIKKPTVQQSHGYFLDLYTLESKDDGTLSFKVNHFSPYIAKLLLEKILENLNRNIGQSDITKTKMAIDFLLERRSETNLVGMREVIAKMIEEQTKVLMLANISNDYVFSIIDPAVISESPSGPNRKIINLFGLILGFFISISYLMISRFFFK